MLKAEEAAMLANKTVDESLDNLYKAIESSAKSGKYYISIDIDISSMERKRLAELGYIVESESLLTMDGRCHVSQISWIHV